MRLNQANRLILVWGIPSKEGLKEIKKANAVLIPEMRPYILGLKIAERLKTEGMKPIYITDNTLGLFFYKHKIKKTLFFYKRRHNDYFSGICGSLYVCLLAKLHHVPIQALKGAEIDLGSFDKSASTMDGYLFYKNEAIEAKDECVPMEIVA